MRKNLRFSIVLTVFLAVVFLIWPGSLPARIRGGELSATVNFRADEKLSPDALLEITLSRPPDERERIAVTFDQTDVSGLFTRTENRLRYDAGILPLPAGNTGLKVYLVSADGLWKEIAGFQMSVADQTPSEPVADGPESESKTPPAEDGSIPGSDQTSETADAAEKSEPEAVENQTEETPASEKTRFFNFLPSFTINMKSQPFQSNFPAENRPAERATSNDFTFSGSIRNEARIGGFSADSNFDLAGSSFKPETLQFGSKGRQAPDVDLASYLINFQVGKAKFAWGHTSFGNNRHLVSSFSSRGISFAMPVGKRFDVSAGVLNGTSLVGVGNFTGLGKVRHQVQGATLGIELFPQRPNAMRLEFTGFNGYLQALNGVSEGRINDAERSRGFGLRFLTSDSSDRFRLEIGYALSRFFNPQDTTLDPEGEAVPLPAVIRSASYIEAGYQVLKNIKLTESKNLNLNFAFKFEVAEPLYRSLGASASADRLSQDYSADGSIGEMTFSFGHSRSNDNLRRVASILRSLTRGNRFSLAVPFSALVGKTEKPSPFLPRLGYSFDRTHQFGEGIPVGGGFEIDPASIPDQVNTNQTFSSAWQFEKFNFEYTYNRTQADNRQADFELNDQIGWTHGISVGVNPLQTLSFNVGLNFDTSKNLEISQTNRTKTLTLGANWQPFKDATLSGNFSNTLSGDAANIINNRNANFDVQFAYNFRIEKSKFRKFGMQAFVRFADTYARNRDFSFEVNDRTRTRIVNAGLTFNFF